MCNYTKIEHLDRLCGDLNCCNIWRALAEHWWMRECQDLKVLDRDGSSGVKSSRWRLRLPLFFFRLFCREDDCWYVWERGGRRRRGRVSNLSGWIRGLCCKESWDIKRWQMWRSRGEEEVGNSPSCYLFLTHTQEGGKVDLMEDFHRSHTSKHRTVRQEVRRGAQQERQVTEETALRGLRGFTQISLSKTWRTNKHWEESWSSFFAAYSGLVFTSWYMSFVKWCRITHQQLSCSAEWP